MPDTPVSTGTRRMEAPANSDSPKYDVIAIGASAGGLNALSRLLADLPAQLRCAVLVVQHLSPDHRSRLVELLVRKTTLQVKQAHDGDDIERGTVYVAPPDMHLMVEGHRIKLLQGPAVRHARPSVDQLFDSVSSAYGDRCIAVVLTGSGSDGAMGLRAIKQAGGVTIAEDPKGAEFSSMPQAAVATGCVDMVLPLAQIAGSLVELSRMRIPATNE